MAKPSITEVPHAGQEIDAFGAMRLLLVKTGEETGGELLEMEATYSGEAGMPPAHLHPSQAERFEVLEGSMRAKIGDEDRVYEAGEAFDVPPGTPHQMAAEGPTRMRWEVRPALRTAEFFECLYGSGPGSAQDLGEKFFEKYSAEFRLTES
jgi:mannose-6-phosphate isomerase-like protein (cupin superfamily)